MISDILLRYEIWLIAGLVLIAIDVLIGLDFILLSFGVGAISAGIFLLVDQSVVPLPVAGEWEAVTILFAIISLCVLVPLRKFARRPAKNAVPSDINKY